MEAKLDFWETIFSVATSGTSREQAEALLLIGSVTSGTSRERAEALLSIGSVDVGEQQPGIVEKIFIDAVVSGDKEVASVAVSIMATMFDVGIIPEYAALDALRAAYHRHVVGEMAVLRAMSDIGMRHSEEVSVFYDALVHGDSETRTFARRQVMKLSVERRIYAVKEVLSQTDDAAAIEAAFGTLIDAYAAESEDLLQFLLRLVSSSTSEITRYIALRVLRAIHTGLDDEDFYIFAQR